ncbi:phage repressor protein C with HTH and peptisase S24 domain [Neisseria sp. HSC-16F19]|nr:helix-turn-helix transcriptional regulator [Neisseria sp. HSC-16F19]MCP2039458.1 phage repressor protein C with HTH and peptisase S24 domain [Neisseria sp. HSC-16F19]
MDTFKDRLAFLWPNEKQAKIAADIDMTLAGFSRIWHEGGLPKAETLKKIKQLKGCNLDWLLTGEGSPFPDDGRAAPKLYNTLGKPVDADEFVFVPRYDIEAAAGHGRLAGDEEPVYAVPFRHDWVAAFGKPGNLAVIAVRGDSMEGVLNDGDTILITLTDHIRRDGLYVLRINDSLLVKRLQLMPGGLINVISANEAYASFEINPATMQDEVAVIGKVVWFGRHV